MDVLFNVQAAVEPRERREQVEIDEDERYQKRMDEQYEREFI